MNVLFVMSDSHPMISDLHELAEKNGVKVTMLFTPYVEPFRCGQFYGEGSGEGTIRVLLNALSFLTRLLAAGKFSIVGKLSIAAIRASSLASVWSCTIYLHFAKMIALSCQTFNVGMVHAFWSHPAGISSILAKTVVERPIVVSVLGYDSDERTLGHPFYKEASRLALEEADAVICAEPRYRTVVRIKGQTNGVHSINPGVNTQRFSPSVDRRRLRDKYKIRDDETLVAFGPSLGEIYHPEEFIRAAGIVTRRTQNVVFMLAGEGHDSCRLDLMEMASRTGTRAIFLGRIPYRDMPYFYAAADLYCVTCYMSHGISVLEAMASGKPVIGYDCPEGMYILNGVDGFTVKQDNVEQLAEQMLILIREEELRKKMGENARSRAVSLYDMRAYYDHHLTVYEDVMENDQGKPCHPPITGRD